MINNKVHFLVLDVETIAYPKKPHPEIVLRPRDSLRRLMDAIKGIDAVGAVFDPRIEDDSNWELYTPIVYTCSDLRITTYGINLWMHNEARKGRYRDVFHENYIWKTLINSDYQDARNYRLGASQFLEYNPNSIIHYNDSSNWTSVDKLYPLRRAHVPVYPYFRLNGPECEERNLILKFMTLEKDKYFNNRSRYMDLGEEYQVDLKFTLTDGFSRRIELNHEIEVIDLEMEEEGQNELFVNPVQNIFANNSQIEIIPISNEINNSIENNDEESTQNNTQQLTQSKVNLTSNEKETSQNTSQSELRDSETLANNNSQQNSNVIPSSPPQLNSSQSTSVPNQNVTSPQIITRSKAQLNSSNETLTNGSSQSKSKIFTSTPKSKTNKTSRKSPQIITRSQAQLNNSGTSTSGTSQSKTIPPSPKKRQSSAVENEEGAERITRSKIYISRSDIERNEKYTTPSQTEHNRSRDNLSTNGGSSPNKTTRSQGSNITKTSQTSVPQESVSKILQPIINLVRVEDRPSKHQSQSESPIINLRNNEGTVGEEERSPPQSIPLFVTYEKFIKTQEEKIKAEENKSESSDELDVSIVSTWSNKSSSSVDIFDMSTTGTNNSKPNSPKNIKSTKRNSPAPTTTKKVVRTLYLDSKRAIIPPCDDRITQEDVQKMLDFIVKNKYHEKIKGRWLYEEMIRKQVVKNTNYPKLKWQIESILKNEKRMIRFTIGKDDKDKMLKAFRQKFPNLEEKRKKM